MKRSRAVGWEAAEERAHLMVRHVTELYYENEAEEAHSEIRKSPVDTGLQRLVTSKVEVEPPALLRKHTDYFGNVVHHFDLLEPHRAVCITAESIVEVAHAVACGPEAEPDARPWEERWVEYLNPSPFVPEIPQYATIEHRVDRSLDADEFMDALEDLGATLKRDFRYDPGATDVDSSPAIFFEEGGGVCQDFSHVCLGVLRHARVPARYASGYVYDPVSDPAAAHLRGASASHAWVQVWHRDLGWVGLDPTNDRLVDWQYVRVAVGRDYGDVRPVRGIFRGLGDQSLSVSVNVTRLDGRV